uniref:Uncharacterized protein n=1 Tax=Gadus morhua TaxID=8049 RepID=A0A8C5AV09_GADMO
MPDDFFPSFWSCAQVFTVQLSLGEQVWEAEGTSIKKAQHTTASTALTDSLLPRPAARCPKVDINSNPGSITPQGEPAIYRPLDPKPMPTTGPTTTSEGCSTKGTPLAFQESC